MMRIHLLISLFLLSTFFVSNANAIDGAAGHMVEAIPKKDVGKEVYEKYCMACHHKERIGIAGPPLIPAFLRKYKLEDLVKKIRNGFPQTLMPSYEFLTTWELLEVARYIKRPVNKDFTWTKEDIKKSITKLDTKPKDIGIKNIEQVLPVVERDGGYVWIMEDEKILDKFPLKNVHGGIKYQFPDAENIFVPTRDGWVERYSLKEGRPVVKARPCINLRNVSLSRDGKNVVATCLLPEQMVVMESSTLEPKKVIKLDGKVSALYEFYSKDQMIFTYRDKPLVGIVDSKTFDINYTKIKEPIEDFFIDPFDKYLIATARHGKVLRVFDIETLKPVFEHQMEGMPHLFSATYWYKDGNFYFATPHLRKPYITIWKMYDWKFEKQIDIGGDGFFVKTHPNTPYLWIDNGTDELVLVSKEDFSIKKMVPVKGKQYIHAEFTGDGKYTYLSIYEHNGSIEVWDTKSFKKLASYPCDIPVGKYNYINKNRQFYPRLFGLDIFNQKCKDKKEPVKCMQNLQNLNTFEKKCVSDYLKGVKK
jgi:mono/diheme cytochrome c family protein